MADMEVIRACRDVKRVRGWKKAFLQSYGVTYHKLSQLKTPPAEMQKVMNRRVNVKGMEFWLQQPDRAKLIITNADTLIKKWLDHQENFPDPETMKLLEEIDEAYSRRG